MLLYFDTIPDNTNHISHIFFLEPEIAVDMPLGRGYGSADIGRTDDIDVHWFDPAGRHALMQKVGYLFLKTDTGLCIQLPDIRRGKKLLQEAQYFRAADII